MSRVLLAASDCECASERDCATLLVEGAPVPAVRAVRVGLCLLCEGSTLLKAPLLFTGVYCRPSGRVPLPGSPVDKFECTPVFVLAVMSTLGVTPGVAVRESP